MFVGADMLEKVAPSKIKAHSPREVYIKMATGKPLVEAGGVKTRRKLVSPECHILQIIEML